MRAGTVEVPTTKLEPGRRKVVREGRPGVRKVVAVKTLHNGEPVKYRVVKRKVVKDPRRAACSSGASPTPSPAPTASTGVRSRTAVRRQPARGQPGRYYGLYQFDLGTWRSVGGSGLPTDASAGEQTYRLL